MNSFSPLTTYSSPSSVAVVFRAVRSEPAPGSVSAKPDSASPLASLGRKRCFCSGVPKVRTGSTAPMQPWIDAMPAIIASSVAVFVKKLVKRWNGAPWPPYFGSMSRPQ